ncbi:MAG: PilZ domain-containing protein [Desulfofustis sp.]|nr:PilZ domain-containing protein [Desulfofustis sp.]MBT8355621.1 PilZ domain-containing protein [Desulfofustis sp.]NNF46880.1 PilZ domain-containing protein [Desulfofustis sp.]NNK56998.1 PilZ domain-containing protein [Desulfofustis sp.]
MSEKKKDWDEIPSLEGLQMDWDYSGNDSLGNRRFERLTYGDVTEIFEVKAVPVRVATPEFTIDGTLSDISGGGVAVILKKSVKAGQQAKIGFFLGQRKIISRVVARQRTEIQNGFRIGFEFKSISEEDSTYINGLYSSKMLSR